MKLLLILVYIFLVIDCVPSKVLFGEVTTLLKLSDTFPSLNTTNILFIQENQWEPDTFFISVNRSVLLARWGSVDQPRLEIIAGNLNERGYREGTDALFGFVVDAIQINDGLIVTDALNDCLRIIRPPRIESSQWRTSTYAGKCQVGGSKDGRLLDARFDFPLNLIQQSDDLFIADYNNQKLRKLNMNSGEVTTIHLSDAYHPLDLVFSGTENGFFLVVKHGILQVTEEQESWLVGWRKETVQQEKAPFSTAGFGSPQAIAWLSDGILLVVDHKTRSIKVVDFAKKEVDVLCPLLGRRPVDGDVKRCVLHNPLSLLVVNNTILIGDNNGIRSLEFQIVDDTTTLPTTKTIPTTTTQNQIRMCQTPPPISNAVYESSESHREGSAIYYHCSDGYTNEVNSNNTLVCVLVNDEPVWIGRQIKCRLAQQTITASVLATICICTVIAIVVTAVKLKSINKQLEEATKVCVKFHTTTRSEAGCSSHTFSSNCGSYLDPTLQISTLPDFLAPAVVDPNIPKPAPRLAKQTNVYSNSCI